MLGRDCIACPKEENLGTRPVKQKRHERDQFDVLFFQRDML